MRTPISAPMSCLRLPPRVSALIALVMNLLAAAFIS
jgi:hypothetical protein